jgi:hypothetical protein
MLSQGHAPKIESKNKPGVTALREIAAGESRPRDAAQGAGLSASRTYPGQRAPRAPFCAFLFVPTRRRSHGLPITLWAELLPTAAALAGPAVTGPRRLPASSSSLRRADRQAGLPDARPTSKQVREAYKFADEAHLGQFRASGEPYITHPIAVAGLVADWKLDAQALMAALMHDAMEDCGVTKPELIERFGAPRPSWSTA